MTTVKLLNVPFENNYKDTVYFENKQEQETYMNSKVVKTYTDVTYQRKENKIRVPAHIDTLYNCNYVAYTNTPYTNKTFYAFITNMEYVHDECTLITIETDVIQSWMFDYTVKESFIEREHAIDDQIGVHTVPEMVETGEYICDYKTESRMFTETCIVLGSTINLTDILNDKEDFRSIGGDYYNGVYSGIAYYAIYGNDSISTLNKIIGRLAEEGKSDALVSVFMAPFYLLDVTGSGTGTALYTILQGVSVTGREWEFEFRDGDNDELPTAPTKIDGYTPKNNKLLSFPYCYLYASNNAGGGCVYHYELFKNRKIDFKIYSAITPGMSIRLIPQNYKYYKTGDIIRRPNNSEGLNLGKFPVCAWTTDVYTNWLTQNSVNIGMNVVSSGLQIVGGAVSVATGGALLGAGMIASGSTGIINTLGQVYQHSLIPPSVSGNINSGDVTFGSKQLTFTLYQMNIKKEYAKIIDNYFTMFGYKTNIVKIPEKNHRKYFWYTKTIDVNIDGSIPNNDLQKIKNCYDQGITFWKPSASMGVYSVDNSIV